MTVSDERLTQIRGRLANLAEIRDAAREDDMPAFSGLTPEQLCGIALAYEQDVPALLAEVERLRDENAAMREIVRQVAACDNSDGVACFQLCPIRDLSYRGMDNEWYEHTGPCVFDQARALVAQWDTPAD